MREEGEANTDNNMVNPTSNEILHTCECMDGYFEHTIIIEKISTEIC